MPTQLLVGPYAPSGKNAMVATRRSNQKRDVRTGATASRTSPCSGGYDWSAFLARRRCAGARVEVRNVRKPASLELAAHPRERHVDRRAIAHCERDDHAAPRRRHASELVEEGDHVAERDELERAVVVRERVRVRHVVVHVSAEPARLVDHAGREVGADDLRLRPRLRDDTRDATGARAEVEHRRGRLGERAERDLHRREPLVGDASLPRRCELVERPRHRPAEEPPTRTARARRRRSPSGRSAGRPSCDGDADLAARRHAGEARLRRRC